MSASDHLERARLLLQQGRYDQAEQQLRQALAQDPNHPIVHALLGICLTTRDDREGAIAACENAVSLAPDFSFTHHVFARTLNHFDRLTEAEAAVREAIRLDPENPEYHGTLALFLLNRKKWPEALAAAETGLQLNAEEVDCLNYRAIALTRLGRRDEAGQSIHTALEQDPDNAHSHANMGWTLLHAGDHRKALDHFREALRLDPDLEWARLGIIEALKAHNPIYRPLLKWALWMSGLSSRAQWGLIIGLVIGINLLTSPKYASPAMQWFAGIALALYVVFIFLVWLRTALFDLLLRFNRFGRLALPDDRRRDTNWLAAALLLHAVMAGSVLFWLRSPDQAFGYTLPLLAIAVTLNLRPAKRKLFIVATSVIYAALLTHFGMSLPPLMPEDVRLFQQAATEGNAQAMAYYEALDADRKASLARYVTWRGHLKDIAQWGPVIMTWLGSYAATRRD